MAVGLRYNAKAGQLRDNAFLPHHKAAIDTIVVLDFAIVWSRHVIFKNNVRKMNVARKYSQILNSPFTSEQNLLCFSSVDMAVHIWVHVRSEKMVQGE